MSATRGAMQPWWWPVPASLPRDRIVGLLHRGARADRQLGEAIVASEVRLVRSRRAVRVTFYFDVDRLRDGLR